MRVPFYRAAGRKRIAAAGEPWRIYMMQSCRYIWSDDQGQDIAEYAVMLAVILVLVIGTVRLIGGNANNVFSSVASSMSQ